MSRVNTIRWIGLAGALLSSIALAINGQVNEAIGVIAAALSSAGVLSPNA